MKRSKPTSDVRNVRLSQDIQINLPDTFNSRFTAWCEARNVSRRQALLASGTLLMNLGPLAGVIINTPEADPAYQSAVAMIRTAFLSVMGKGVAELGVDPAVAAARQAVAAALAVEKSSLQGKTHRDQKATG